MMRFYRFLLLLFMAIALAIFPHTLTFSQTPKPTVSPTKTAKPPATAIVKSGTYQRVSCSTLGKTTDSQGGANPSLFPISDATEGTDYECGYLTVPELHRQPDGKTIQVGIVRIKSTNPKPAEPLIMFQGGPGGSSISIFAPFASASYKMGKQLRADRDLIAFETRGNRYSQPWLSCPERKQVSDTSDSKDADLKALQACRDRLTQSGVNLAAFNSVESAHDVAALVKALKYDKVNLYGVSYGTELVFNIMREHPEMIRSVIVDGIVPPTPSMDSLSAVSLDRLITDIDATCAKDPDCNAQYPNLKQTFQETYDRLNQKPASVRGLAQGVKLTGHDFADALFGMAYFSGSPFVMPAMIDQASKGEFLMVAQILNRKSSSGRGDFSDGTFFSVKCSEDIAYAGKLVVDGVSPFAQDWGTRTLQKSVDKCKVWNVPAVAPAARKLVVSKTPALLLNGEFDPITPPSYGKLVAQGLSNSTNVVFPANGHGAIMSGSCAVGIIANFLNQPNQSPDTACVNEQKITFITKKNTLIAPGTSWSWLVRSNADGSFIHHVLLLSLLILFPLVWFVTWLIARLRRKAQPSPSLPIAARWAPWLGVLLALLSVAWIVLQFVDMYATSLLSGHGGLGFLQLYVGIDRNFAWIYVVPILIALLSVIMAILAVLSWKHPFWGRGRRFYYSFTAGVAIAYTLLLAAAGQLTVFFY